MAMGARVASLLGIPWVKARVMQCRWGDCGKGVRIQAKDVVDVMVGMDIKRKEWQQSFGKRKEESLVASREEAGLSTSPEFFALMQEIGALEDAVVVNVVKDLEADAAQKMGSADESVVEQARTTLVNAIERIQEEKKDVEGMLSGAFDVPPLPAVALPHATMTAFVGVLCGTVSFCSLVPLMAAAALKSGVAPTWMMVLATQCTPCARVSDVVAVLVDKLDSREHCWDDDDMAKELRTMMAVVETTEDGEEGFRFDPATDLIWIRGTASARAKVRVALFDAKTQEYGIADYLSRALQWYRADMVSGDDRIPRKAKMRLGFMTIPLLRAEAREMGVSLRSKTRKQDIIDLMVEAFENDIDAYLDRGLNKFLEGDAMACNRKDVETAKAFLHRHGNDNLLVRVMRLFHARCNYRETVTSVAEEAVVARRARMLWAKKVADVTKETWIGEKVVFHVPSLHMLATKSMKSDQSNKDAIDNIVRSITAERDAWIANQDAAFLHCSERKALLEQKLKMLGFTLDEEYIVCVGGVEIDVRPEGLPPSQPEAEMPGPFPSTSRPMDTHFACLNAFLRSDSQSMKFLGLTYEQDQVLASMFKGTCIRHHTHGGRTVPRVVTLSKRKLAPVPVFGMNVDSSLISIHGSVLKTGAPFLVVDRTRIARADPPNRDLWNSFVRFVSLRWPLRLTWDDQHRLKAAVESQGPLRVPDALIWRTARRNTLLDALRRVGVPFWKIPMTVGSSRPCTGAWINVSKPPVSRAMSAALVNNAPASIAHGDIFACLPIEIVGMIVSLTASRDFVGAATASSSFGLGASVFENQN